MNNMSYHQAQGGGAAGAGEPPSYAEASRIDSIYPTDQGLHKTNARYDSVPYPGAMGEGSTAAATAYPGPAYPGPAYPGPAYPTPYAGSPYPTTYQGGPPYPVSPYQGSSSATPYQVPSYPAGAGYQPASPAYTTGGRQDGRVGRGAEMDDVALISEGPPSVVIVSNSDGMGGGAGGEPGEEWGRMSSFSDKSIRQAFIRKVFLILMAQLSVTVGFICLFIFCEPLKKWVRSTGYWFYGCAYAVFLVTYIVLVCCPSVRRAWPSNVICLAVFTLALSYMTGTISSYHDTEIVLIAIGITAAVCLSLTIFALQTRIDFTMCSGLLFALCMVVFYFGFATLIGGAFMGYHSYYIMHCVYGGLAALLFSLFLVYDIQMVMGGRKYELSPEEYIFGALQIYLDVVYLFIIILGLFGGKK